LFGVVLALGDVEEAGAGRSSERSPSNVRNHDKLNLDRLFANLRHIGHHRHESGLHKAGNQLPSETMGKHEGVGKSARDVGKPLQCVELARSHFSLLRH
jgi:hypothetical protein